MAYTPCRAGAWRHRGIMPRRNLCAFTAAFGVTGKRIGSAAHVTARSCCQAPKSFETPGPYISVQKAWHGGAARSAAAVSRRTFKNAWRAHAATSLFGKNFHRRFTPAGRVHAGAIQNLLRLYRRLLWRHAFCWYTLPARVTVWYAALPAVLRYQRLTPL